MLDNMQRKTMLCRYYLAIANNATEHIMSARSDSDWETFLALKLDTSSSALATYADSLRGCALSLYLRTLPSTPMAPCVTCSFQEMYAPKASRLIRLCTCCLKAEFLLESTWAEMSLVRFNEDLQDLCARCSDRVPRTESERSFKQRICPQSLLKSK